MKTRNYFFLAALLTMGLAACTEMDEMPESPQSRVPVQLTTQLTAVDADVTRAATSLNNTALTSGNVNVWLSGAYGTAYTYTAGSGGALTSSSPAYYPSSGTVDIVAVYPSGKISNASTSTNFDVQADQTSDANYKASDLMRGMLTGKSKSSGAQTIPLSHKMSKIIVNVTAGDGVSSINSVTLNNIKRRIAYTASTDALGAATEISGTDVSVGTNNCAAVVPPQTISANTNFLTIVTNVGTAVYKFASAKALSSGYYYQLNITVNRTATLATNTIAAWDGSGAANIGATTTAGELEIATIAAQTYTGFALTPAPSYVKLGSTTLTSGTHYELVYTNNINAGTATVTAVGKGTYAGKVGVKEFTINKAALPSPTISSTSMMVATAGSTHTATFTVTYVGDGVANAVSSDGTKATVAKTSSSSGSATFTVTGVASGSASINVSIASGTNYLAYSGSGDVSVTVVGDFVDLGLSSGTKWARYNVGATTETGYGAYYQWGGTTDCTSTSVGLGYNNNCPYWVSGTSGSSTKWSKYVPTGKSTYWGASGDPDNKTTLDLADDAAYVNFGSTWCMPTEAQWQELINGCDWEWTTISSVAGYKVKKKSDNSVYIFLPAAGYRYGTHLQNQGWDGHYWSSSLYTDSPYYSHFLNFISSSHNMNRDGNRCSGYSVRAVLR